MKKILVPTDFSDCAESAVEVALHIAKKVSAEVYFVHLFPDVADEMHVPHRGIDAAKEPHTTAALGKVRDQLAKLMLKAERLGIKAVPVLVHDFGQEKIENYVKPYNIDFIVMGSHGATGIKETFFGSNTQRIIRHTSVPVLVVKHPVKELSIKTIAFASSFEEDSIKSFEQVRYIADVFNAAIHLLYVNTPQNFKETHTCITDMKRFMHQFRGVKYTPVVYNAFEEERGIHRYATDNAIDLIALCSHGKTGFSRLLSTGLSERIINHEDVPVLVINTNAKVSAEQAQH